MLHEYVHYTRPYKKAVAIQEIVFQRTKEDDLSPSALASLANAFAKLEELKRLMKMKPAPKPVDVANQTKSRKAPVEPSFTEQ